MRAVLRKFANLSDAETDFLASAGVVFRDPKSNLKTELTSANN